MPQYVDLETLIVMFKTSYKHSTLRGDEIARILEVRFGKDAAEKPKTDANNSQSNR